MRVCLPAPRQVFLHVPRRVCLNQVACLLHHHRQAAAGRRGTLLGLLAAGAATLGVAGSAPLPAQAFLGLGEDGAGLQDDYAKRTVWPSKDGGAARKGAGRALHARVSSIRGGMLVHVQVWGATLEVDGWLCRTHSSTHTLCVWRRTAS
jgi:hypothetical protein